MEEKTWTVVQFLDDRTVEAVPSAWVQGDMCHWPSYSQDKLISSIRRSEPLNTCWPSHKVKIFRNSTFDNYAKARAKAKLAEETSDLVSDTVDNENVDGKSKRKRIQKILSSSGSSDSDNSLLDTPPKLGTKFVKYGQDKNEFKTNERPSTLRPPLKICQEITDENVPSKDVGNSTEFTGTRAFPENSKPDACQICKGTDEQNLEKFEDVLGNADDFDIATKELSKYGGSNLYHFVKRVLSALVSDKMAIQYSFLGRKGKKPFKPLRLTRLVLESAEKSQVCTTINDTEKAIATWLRRSSDRKASIHKKFNT